MECYRSPFSLCKTHLTRLGVSLGKTRGSTLCVHLECEMKYGVRELELEAPHIP